MRYRRLRLTAGLVAALLFAGGCGTARPADDGGSKPAAKATAAETPNEETGPAPSPWDPDDGDVLRGAVVLHRTGGIAGFADRLVVDADGEATLTSKGKDDVTCTVDSGLMSRITATTRALDAEGEPQVQAGFEPKVHPDKLYYFLTYRDTRVQYDQLDETAAEWRDLFTPLSEVLSAATALRGSADPPDTDACLP